METLRETGLTPVGCAKRMTKPRHPADMVAASARSESDCLGPVLFTDCEHTLCNLVERVVPGNALPLARLTLALAPHRIFQSIWMINKIGRHRTDRTQAPVVER